MDEQHELAVLGGEEEPLRAALGAGKTPTIERRERRVEGLQRRDVRRPGLLDREGADRIVQRSAPGFDLRQFWQLRSVPWRSRSA